MTDTRDDDSKQVGGEEPLTAGQSEADQRRRGWKGEEMRDDSDKPNTEDVPDPARRKPGAYVNPEA